MGFFKELFKKPFEFKELLRQCYSIGNKSLLLVGVTGFIIGLVITLQTRPTLEEFGAESWMPSMVSISIVREIGPVIIALIVVELSRAIRPVYSVEFVVGSVPSIV